MIFSVIGRIFGSRQKDPLTSSKGLTIHAFASSSPWVISKLTYLDALILQFCVWLVVSIAIVIC